MSVQLLKKFRNNRCWSDINIEEIKLFLDSKESIFNKIVDLSMKNEKIIRGEQLGYYLVL